jgi:hypothetical protein
VEGETYWRIGVLACRGILEALFLVNAGEVFGAEGKAGCFAYSRKLIRRYTETLTRCSRIRRSFSPKDWQHGLPTLDSSTESASR